MKIISSLIFIIILTSAPVSASKIQSTLEENSLLYCGFGLARPLDEDESFTDFSGKHNDYKRITINFALLKVMNPFIRYGIHISEITLKENDYMKNNEKNTSDSNIYLTPFLFSAGIEIFPFSRYLFLKGSAGLAIALEIKDPQTRFTNSEIQNLYPGAGFLAGIGIQLFEWNNNMGKVISFIAGCDYCYHKYSNDKIDNINYINFYLAVGWSM